MVDDNTKTTKPKDLPVQSRSKTVASTITGEHEHVIVNYSLLKGVGDGEPIASEKFVVGGHEWVLLFYPDGKKSQSDQHNLSHNRGDGIAPEVSQRLPRYLNPWQPQAGPGFSLTFNPSVTDNNQNRQNDPLGFRVVQDSAGNQLACIRQGNNEEDANGQQNVVPLGGTGGQGAQGAQANTTPTTASMLSVQLMQPQQVIQPRRCRENNANNDYCALFVALIGEGPNPLGVVNTNEGKVVRAFHRFTLVDQSGQNKHLEKGRRREDGAVKISCSRQDPNARNCHGYRKFVRKHTLESPEKGFLVNDTIIIRYTIELVVTQGGVFQKNAPNLRHLGMQPRRQITEDLSNLYESKKFMDIKFLVKGEEIMAHKLVLQARSEVFDLMFSCGMQEQKGSAVEVKDIRNDIFKAMLHFIYTDTLPEQFDDDNFDFAVAQHLMVAADRFQLHGLRQMCEGRLQEVIDMDNVCDTLHLADSTHATDLKKTCLEYIAHHLEYVISTDGYSKVLQSNSSLLHELNEAVAKVGYGSTGTANNKAYQRYLLQTQAVARPRGNDDAEVEQNPRKRHRRDGNA